MFERAQLKNWRSSQKHLKDYLSSWEALHSKQSIGLHLKPLKNSLKIVKGFIQNCLRGLTQDHQRDSVQACQRASAKDSKNLPLKTTEKNLQHTVFTQAHRRYSAQDTWKSPIHFHWKFSTDWFDPNSFKNIEDIRLKQVFDEEIQIIHN